MTPLDSRGTPLGSPRSPACSRLAAALLRVLPSLPAILLAACGSMRSPAAPTTTAGVLALSGTVRDSVTQAGVPAVKIDVLDARFAGKSATTDADGHYVIDGVDGSVSVRASRVGYRQDTETVAVAGPTRLDFELVRVLVTSDQARR